MDDGKIQVSEKGNIIILVVTGYFNEIIGAQANQLVEKYALEGKNLFVLDFAACTLINSPGVASMVDITLKITDDFQGKLALTGIDQMKWTIFKMVSIIQRVQTASTIQEGCQLIS